MNKLIVSDQIRTLRKSKGLSQEVLAENAGINLRTLQRVEAGNAEPRSETLRLIAQALGVPVESFSNVTEERSAAIEEDPGLLKLMNLSALSFWFIPMGNILIPLAFWIFKKSQVQGVRELGKRILNFQITWSLIVYAIAIAAMYSIASGRSFIDPFALWPVMLSLCVLNTVFIIITHRKIVRGEENVYPFSLKLIN